MDYLPTKLMKDMELELGIKMAHIQPWRAREYVQLLNFLGMAAKLSVRSRIGGE